MAAFRNIRLAADRPPSHAQAGPAVGDRTAPNDAARLKTLFAGDFQTRVIELDGWLALGAHLPPKEKRGLVLIDPPFEEEGEFERLVDGLQRAHKRWPGGIYALWYPIKDRKAVIAFRKALKQSRIPKLLDIEFEIRPASVEPSLDGSGMVVVNPPFTLEGELRIVLPVLHKLLVVEKPAHWTLEWLAENRRARRGAPASPGNGCRRREARARSGGANCPTTSASASKSLPNNAPEPFRARQEGCPAKVANGKPSPGRPRPRVPDPQMRAVDPRGCHDSLCQIRSCCPDRFAPLCTSASPRRPTLPILPSILRKTARLRRSLGAEQDHRPLLLSGASRAASA